MTAARLLATLTFLALSFTAPSALAQQDDDEAANSISGQPSLTLAPPITPGGGGNSFVISAGPANGLGYAMAGALCTAYNVQADPDAPTCLVRTTTGSAENLALMADRRADFAVVQSDRQYFAFSGQADYAGEDAIEDLRTVFSFGILPLHVLLSSTSRATTLRDLENGRVGLGAPGSSQRTLSQATLFASEVAISKMQYVEEGPLGVQIDGLCNNQLDAVIFPTVLPSQSVEIALWECGARLAPLASDGIEVLVDSNPFFEPIVIPAAAYNMSSDVETIGLAITLVTREDVPHGRVIELIQAAYSDFDFFKSMHPALGLLDKEGALRAGLVAPQHRGLQQYLEVQAQYSDVDTLD
ncbi:MAG: TAXI family TRAP transporter solute-binding subunit [Alphaproteobacteria bacterium]